MITGTGGDGSVVKGRSSHAGGGFVATGVGFSGGIGASGAAGGAALGGLGQPNTFAGGSFGGMVQVAPDSYNIRGQQPTAVRSQPDLQASWKGSKS
jgi:hypothetical protein